MDIVAETPRLVLRKYTLEDVPLLHAIASDAETMSHYPAPFTLEKSTEWIARSIRTYGELGFGRYAVLHKPTNEYIGCVGFFRTPVNDVMENDLGYIIAKPHWGKGFATEASRACLDLARKERWFSRVVIQMACDHVMSANVAIRLGAKLERTFINARNRDKLTNLFVIQL